MQREFIRRLNSAPLLACAILAALPFSARAELMALPDGATENPGDSISGVYVRDSGVVKEKLDHAQRMAKQGEWDKSADLYQEILTKYPDRVVAVSTEKGKERFISVASSVQEQLRNWPEPGLRAYNARFDSAANELLKNAPPHDVGTLQQVFTQYFATNSGRAAGIALIDESLESGEFLSAAWTGERLLNLHPNLKVERAKVLYRTAVAYHLAGDSASAKRCADELIQKFPNDPGTLRGADATLAKEIEQNLKAPPILAMARAEQGWQTFGGSIERNVVEPAAGKPGARMFSIDIVPPDAPPTNAAMQVPENLNPRRKADGAFINIFPVIDKGQLFFQDGRRVYAIDGASGMPLQGWTQTYLGMQGKYRNNSTIPSTASQYTLTLTDDRVLAVMAKVERMALGGQPRPTRASQLVCLDRQTGKELWVGPRDIPDSLAPLKSAELTGSPLVLGDNVYITLRNSKGFQFSDSFVCCMELATGKFKWATYIVSTSGATPMYEQVNIAPLTETHLSAMSGRVFICSDLGAVASLDSATGQVVWLSLYPREGGAPQSPQIWANRRRPLTTSQQPVSPWANNPAILQNGKLFVLPTDGNFLHVYDAASGNEIARIDTRMEIASQRDTLDTLLAVMDDRVVVSGEKSIYYLDWRKYAAAPDSAARRNAIVSVGRPSDPIRGRGFVTQTTAYIPTQNKIACMDLKSGSIRETYPSGDNTWDEGEGPGNVVVQGDQVLVATESRVIVYSDLTRARSKLDAEVAAAPNEPEVRLKYAEMMYAAGQMDVATKMLDEGLALLKESPNPTLIDRAFNDCLNFAQRHAAKKNLPLAMEMFDRAARTASSPAQQVVWRITRARLLANPTEPTAPESANALAAVRLYQDILADESLRSVPFYNESGSTVAAWRAAADSIDALIKRSGPSVYAEFETQAQQLLDTAKATANPQQLLQVATQFPNAKSAQTAMSLAADAFELNGDSRQAIRILRQLSSQYPKTNSTQAVLESMARNYLRLPGRVEAAIAQLNKAQRQFDNPRLTRPLILPDGKTLQNIPFAAAVTELRRFVISDSPASLPNLHLPIPTSRKKFIARPLVEQADAAIDSVAAMLAPPVSFARPDRVVLAMVDGSLQVHIVGQSQPLIKVEKLDSAPRSCAWISGGLVAATDTQLRFIQPDANQVTWMIDLQSLPEVPNVAWNDIESTDDARDVPPAPNNNRLRNNRIIIGPNGRMIAPAAIPAPIALPAGSEAISEIKPLSDRVIFSTTAGRVVCVDLASGKLLWQHRPTDRTIDRLLCTEDFTVLKSGDANAAILAAIDNFNGEPIGRRAFGQGKMESPINLALSADGKLVYTQSTQFFVKDLYDPWKKEALLVTAESDENPLNFANATQPDQLHVIDGRIILLSDEGRTVRIHNADTGRLIRWRTDSANVSLIPATLTTSATGWNSKLRVLGSRLYILAPQCVISCNLDNPTDQWNFAVTPEMENLRTFTDLSIDPNFLIVIDEVAKARNIRRLSAFARYSSEGTNAESGRLDYQQEFSHPTGISAIQPAENGLLFLSPGDQKVHFLKTTIPQGK